MYQLQESKARYCTRNGTEASVSQNAVPATASVGSACGKCTCVESPVAMSQTVHSQLEFPTRQAQQLSIAEPNQTNQTHKGQFSTRAKRMNHDASRSCAGPRSLFGSVCKGLLCFCAFHRLANCLAIAGCTCEVTANGCITCAALYLLHTPLLFSSLPLAAVCGLQEPECALDQCALPMWQGKTPEHGNVQLSRVAQSFMCSTRAQTCEVCTPESAPSRCAPASPPPAARTRLR